MARFREQSTDGRPRSQRLAGAFLPLLGAWSRPSAAGGSSSGRNAGGRGDRPGVPRLARALVFSVGHTSATAPIEWLTISGLTRPDPVPGRWPDDDDAGDGHVRRHAGGDLRRRGTWRRPGLLPVLRRHRPVRLLDDRAGALEQLRADVRLLGRRGVAAICSSASGTQSPRRRRRPRRRSWSTESATSDSRSASSGSGSIVAGRTT